MTERPSWDETFLSMARVTAMRSTCPRLSCGTVIVSPDNQVLATGYNGAVRGELHCTDAGCIMEGGHCVRAVHSELNALLQCARLGVSAQGSTLYVTHRTCVRCAAAIVQVGVKRVVYDSSYDTDGLQGYVLARFTAAGIAVSQVDMRQTILRLFADSET